MSEQVELDVKQETVNYFIGLLSNEDNSPEMVVAITGLYKAIMSC